MSRIKLDLKSFKHVKSDKDSTTLQHKDGHQLTIAHKPLSKEAQAQLSALAKMSQAAETPLQSKMADGGKVDKDETPMQTAARELPGDVSEAFSPSGLADTAETVYNAAKNMYSNVMKAEGGEVNTLDYKKIKKEHKEKNQPYSPPEPLNYEKLKKEYQEKNRVKLAEGTPNEPVSADLENLASSLQQYSKPQDLSTPAPVEKPSMGDMLYDAAVSSVTPNGGGNTPMRRLPQQNQQLMMPAQAMPQEEPQQPPAQPSTADAMAGGMNNYENMLMQGYGNQVAGLKGEAAAQGALGKQEAAMLERRAQEQQQALSEYKGHYDTLESERQAHMTDIRNNMIDPNQYWKGTYNPETGQTEGGHSKIAAGIGMILAGFNPAGHPNAAINMVQKLMDQNIHAQGANLQARHNLLAANLQQFGNLKDATMATRIMQNDVLQHQIQQAAALAQDPMAKARAMQAIGQVQKETAPMVQQFAMRRALMGLAQNGQQGATDQMLQYMRITNPEMAKEMESRYVPGMGMGSVPIPQDIRNRLIAHQDVNRTMNIVLQFAKLHSGSVDPKVRAEGATLMNELQSKIRVAEDQGVYKQSEADFMRHTLGDNPAKFFSHYTTVPKIRELQHLKQAEFQNLASGYGLKPPPLQGSNQTPQAALQWAQKNPNDPRAIQILKHLGK